LNALAASVAMTALGKNGVKEMAVQNIQKAHYTKETLKQSGVEIAFEGPSFNEFVIKTKRPVKEINSGLLQKGIIGGYDLGQVDSDLHHHMLVAVTELRTKEEIDTFAKELGDYHA
jgi:glycine dehydrogenase subunit 1